MCYLTSTLIVSDGGLVPYGLISVRELFRLIVMLCNPVNKENTDVIIQLGLTLLMVCLQVGADSIGQFTSILPIVKDDLCRNLFTVSKILFYPSLLGLVTDHQIDSPMLVTYKF